MRKTVLIPFTVIFTAAVCNYCIHTAAESSKRRCHRRSVSALIYYTAHASNRGSWILRRDRLMTHRLCIIRYGTRLNQWDCRMPWWGDFYFSKMREVPRQYLESAQRGIWTRKTTRYCQTMVWSCVCTIPQNLQMNLTRIVGQILATCRSLLVTTPWKHRTCTHPEVLDSGHSGIDWSLLLHL